MKRAIESVKRQTKSAVHSFADKTVVGMRLVHTYHRLRAAFQAKYSDEEFANRSHFKAVGSTLNLDNPTTFDERQWWLKIYYRDPLMIQCTDKIAVRDYVESCGLGDMLRPLYGVYSTPEEIDWAHLPVPCYIKTNNSSGTNIRCNRLEGLNIPRIRKRLRLFLKRDHYALSREWNYRSIEPKLLIEPVIDAGADALVDYRFFCSYGKCQAINVDLGTADEEGRHASSFHGNVYDREWNQLDIQIDAPPIEDRIIPRPKRLDKMLAYAEKLSTPFPFCRVDLYHLDDDTILFGEITFFNNGGNNPIEPRSSETLMGSWVAIPERAQQLDL